MSLRKWFLLGTFLFSSSTYAAHISGGGGGSSGVSVYPATGTILADQGISLPPAALIEFPEGASKFAISRGVGDDTLNFGAVSGFNPFSAYFNGTVTAGFFVGDGSGLTGVVAGGGVASSLGVNLDGVQISSPTAQINFKSPGLLVTLGGSATAQVSLDVSSVTMLGASPTTTSISEGTNQYFTTARSTTSITATSPINNINGTLTLSPISLSTGITGSLNAGLVTGTMDISTGTSGSLNAGRITGMISLSTGVTGTLPDSSISGISAIKIIGNNLPGGSTSYLASNSRLDPSTAAATFPYGLSASTVGFTVASVASSFSGNTLIMVSSETQAVGDAVMISSTTGKAHLAQADVIAHASAVALAATPVTGSASNNYLLSGTLKLSSSPSWTTGQLIYLSTVGSSGNTLTQTAPSAANNVIQILGVALSADTILFQPSLVQVEHN